MSQATYEELESLVQAGVPATVGVGQRDMLDESYRKAGKIDTADFAAKFDVEQARIVDRIRVQLLAGLDESKPIKVEISRLNVYGEWLENRLLHAIHCVDDVIQERAPFSKRTKTHPVTTRCLGLSLSFIQLRTKVVLF